MDETEILDAIESGVDYSDRKKELSNLCKIKPGRIGKNCLRWFPRWGFKDGSCNIYDIDGCKGNRNTYKSKKACHRKCIGSKKPVELQKEGQECVIDSDCEKPLVCSEVFSCEVKRMLAEKYASS